MLWAFSSSSAENTKSLKSRRVCVVCSLGAWLGKLHQNLGSVSLFLINWTIGSIQYSMVQLLTFHNRKLLQNLHQGPHPFSLKQHQRPLCIYWQQINPQTLARYSKSPGPMVQVLHTLLEYSPVHHFLQDCWEESDISLLPQPFP